MDGEEDELINSTVIVDDADDITVDVDVINAVASNRYHSFQMYKGEHKVQQLSESGMRVSVMCLQNDNFAVQLATREQVHLTRCELTDHACGISYFCWELNPAKLIDLLNTIDKYCLFLPHLAATGVAKKSELGISFIHHHYIRVGRTKCYGCLPMIGTCYDFNN